MGQLQNLIVPTALVVVSDKGGFEVRGLSPYDITALFLRHRGELSAMFDQFAVKVKGGQSVGLDDATTMIAGALETAPHIVAEIVALGTGSDPADPDNWQKDVVIATTLSLGVQTEALQKIAGLTFSSEMPPGKFLSVVVGAMQNATATLTTPIASVTGSGKSDEK